MAEKNNKGRMTYHGNEHYRKLKFQFPECFTATQSYSLIYIFYMTDSHNGRAEYL